MSVVISVLLCRDLRKFNHLFSSGKAAWRIKEPGRHAKASTIHALRHTLFHLLELRCSWNCVSHAHHLSPNGTHPDEKCSVGSNPLLIPLLQSAPNRQRTGSVVAGDNGGHTLHEISNVDVALSARAVVQGMRVRMDEARRDVESRRIDETCGGYSILRSVADEDDSIATDAKIADSRRTARTVDQFAMSDE